MSGRRLIAALGSVAAVLVAAPGAHAAPSFQLTAASGGKFPAKTFVLTLPERRDLKPGDVIVRENGQDVDSVRVVPAQAADTRTFATLLVIDTSQSMQGAPIQAAMAAAREFAARRPAQERLGVVFFNSQVTLVLPPTTDAGEISKALATTPPVAFGTRIYDAMALASRILADTRASVRSVLLLSDGTDVGSKLAPRAVVNAARVTNTRIFSVGLRDRSYDGLTLRSLASATDGDYADADEAQLSPMFAALGERFDREYLVSYRSLAPLSTQVKVRVRVAGVAGTASASYTSPAFGANAGPASGAAPTTFLGSNASLGVAVMLAAALFGFAAYLVVRASRRTARARIADFTGSVTSSNEAAEAVAALEPDVARRRTPSRRWAAFAEDVDVAGLPATPDRIAGWTIAGTLLVALLAIAAGKPVLALLAMVAPVVVHLVVASRANAARRDFDAQLADNLQVVASAMRAGQSFVGALAVAVEDAMEPAKRELHRAVTDERLGVPLDEALGRAARRMRSEELEYVGLVATLQRETGGSTAEVLDRITQTIRERAELKRLVRGLTAQGRLGGAIVSAIPLGLTALFLVIRPGYFNPLLQSVFGLMCIVAAVTMTTAGWIGIRKIVDIKV
jgi:tight adherence protein B